MKDELVSFEVAKLAKEKGFSSTTNEYYSSQTKVTSVSYNEFPAPIQSLLQRWLREVHNLEISIHSTPTFDNIYPSKYKAVIGISFQPFKWTTGKFYVGNTYEEALEAGLLQMLKLIK